MVLNEYTVNGAILDGRRPISSASGTIVSFQQNVQRRQTASGTIVSIEQNVKAIASGTIITIQQIVETP